MIKSLAERKRKQTSRRVVTEVGERKVRHLLGGYSDSARYVLSTASDELLPQHWVSMKSIFLTNKLLPDDAYTIEVLFPRRYRIRVADGGHGSIYFWKFTTTLRGPEITQCHVSMIIN